MKEEKNRKASYSLCVITGMLCGIVLGTIMDKLAVGISLGLMFATMYYLFFAKSDKNIDDGEKQIDKLWWSRYNKSDFFFL
ncbi:hypothetical protein [Phocaeicola coprophilus]|uniref:hypothetical protein n=1 Tax=Phocaeicola coprophilus TaxID=387090 RepID=UPI003078216C